MSTNQPVDQPSRESVKVRQGTGPRSMVTILITSLVAAAVLGALLLMYFGFGR
jgi:hypothetical protein